MKKILLLVKRIALDNINYIKVNIGLILFFTAGLAFFVFTNMPLKCVYKESFGILCPTCGMSRDFKEICNGNTEGLINPLSIHYFVGIIILFVSRFFSIALAFWNKLKFSYCIDIIVIVFMFVFFLIK